MLAVFGLSYGALAYALPAAAARRVASEAPAAAPLVASPALAAGGAEQHRLTLSIEKMYCPPCAATVQRLLAKQVGVSAVVASVDSDVVIVDYRPAEVDAAALTRLLPHSYGVTVLSNVALP
jgi:copper chaperone CopZ